MLELESSREGLGAPFGTGGAGGTSPWSKWLRPRGTRSSGAAMRSPPLAARPAFSDGGGDGGGPGSLSSSAALLHEAPAAQRQLDALEERLLALVAGLHRQVAADRQESDHLAELAARRIEGRLGAAEQQQQRLERLVADHAAAAQGAAHEAAARDEEAQRRQVHLLRPLEERLGALEAGLLQHEAAAEGAHDIRAALDVAGASNGAALLAVRDLEARLFTELRALHGRCDRAQGAADSRAAASSRRPLEDSKPSPDSTGAASTRDSLAQSSADALRAGESFSSGPPGAFGGTALSVRPDAVSAALDRRVASCEAASVRSCLIACLPLKVRT